MRSRKGGFPLAALLASALALTGAAQASAAATMHTVTAIENCGQGSPLIRPHSLILTCADGDMVASGLHWTSWTSAKATATATVTWEQNGTRRSTAGDITLSAAATQARGTVLFTKLGLRVTGATPRGFRREGTISEAPTPAITVPSKGAKAGTITPAASGGSGPISYADIAGYWELAGGPDPVAQTAAAITGAEAYGTTDDPAEGGKPGAVQPDEPYSTTGWGLWQITPGDSESTYGVDYQLLDPWNNAEAAVAKYVGDGDSFNPWVTYWDGAYESFVSAASADAPNTELTDPGQFDPTYDFGTTPNGSSSDPGATYGPAMPTTAKPIQVAFNASGTNDLYLYGNGTGAYNGATPVGVAPATSPAVTALAGGGFEIAFNAANSNALWLYGEGSGSVTGETPVGVAPDTSPAIAALPGGGFQVVFNASGSNTLWRYGSGTGSYTGSTPVGMAPGTSPAIAVLSGGGIQIAFNAANTNALTLYGDGSGITDGATPVGVAPDTSPAIAALPGGAFQVVFNASGSNTLWRYGSGAGSYTGSTPDGVAPGTSPAIAVLSGGGIQVAFNASGNNALTLYGDGSGITDGATPVGVATDTSPAIAALPGDGFQVVFNASGSNTLWRYGLGTGSYTGSTPVGLAADTSPSVAVLG